MSFSFERKIEIIKQPNKNACCRRAMLNGVLFAKGAVRDGQIYCNLENTDISEFVASLIKEFFGKETEIGTSPRGGRCRRISFTSPACEKYLTSIDTGSAAYFTEKCATCQSSFLRGVFLACGRVTDPKKSYRLELSPVARHEKLRELLFELGISLSITVRREEKLLYTNNSTASEDYFVAAGMNATAFSLMNSKIESDFKNTANRLRNCETNNIMKSVSAAARWIEAIEALDRAQLLSTLPEELEKTARLRLAYRDYSLARLAAEFTPPISKPGLSHRLNKIVEISESLLGKK